jgi:hypothetical protein
VSFALKGGRTFQVGYAGITLPESAEPVSWDKVANMKYVDGSFGTSDVLQLEHPEKGWLGAKTTKIKLPGIGKQKDRLKAVVGQYWHRHRVSREALQANPQPA